MSHFAPIVTTPNIFTEVSNLALAAIHRRFHHHYLAKFAQVIDLVLEEVAPSKALTSGQTYAFLGLTDAAIEQVAKGKYLVISADFDLVTALQSQGVDAINYNHMRDSAW